jgi:membrane protein
MGEGKQSRDGGERARHAKRPGEVSREGWWDILKRVKKAIARDNVSLISAGVALFALLAVFPTLTALVLIYGLVASPDDIARHMQPLMDVLPAGAAQIIEGQLREVAGGERQTLGLGLVITLIVALWSSRLGMTGLMSATNIAYGEREQRSFFKQLLVSLSLTLGFILGLLILIALAVVVPIVLRVIPLGPVANPLLLGLRWVLLAAFLIVGLAVIYRYAPDRRAARWRWVSWGSVIAAVLWLVATLLFAFYVGNFGNYNEMYGALGGAIILILWFYISAFVIVLGAELNAEIEHQTARP